MSFFIYEMGGRGKKGGSFPYLESQHPEDPDHTRCPTQGRQAGPGVGVSLSTDEAT